MRNALHYAACIAIVLAAIVLRLWFVCIVTVKGDSCEPVLLDGDRVAVRLRAYSDKMPQRGEWVAYTDPRNADSICVGCVFACPGDTLWIDGDGQIGTLSEASDLVVVPRQGLNLEVDVQNIRLYSKAINQHEPAKSAIIDGQLYISGKMVEHYSFTNSYYWMSTTADGIDSRVLGLVPQGLIRGRVSRVLFSHNPSASLFQGWHHDRILRRVGDGQ